MLYADKKDIDRLWEMLRSGKCICSGAITRKFYSWINRFMPWCMRCAAELTGMTGGSISPHFDRTTVLSLQCRPTDKILSDHKNLVEAIEKKDAVLAGQVARQHMDRYSENIDTIYQQFGEYLQNDGSYSSLRAVIFLWGALAISGA